MRTIRTVKHAFLHKWFLFKASRLYDASGKDYGTAKRDIKELGWKLCEEHYLDKDYHFDHVESKSNFY